MPAQVDVAGLKQSFFEENPDFKEVKLNEDSTTIGDFQNIDEIDDEIWLMQCPKGMDITQLQGEKLKLPGRTNANDVESVAVEFSDGGESALFGYCNRKGRYALRLLPVRGSIFVRQRLKANETVTEEMIADSYPSVGRVPVPDCIKVRHPLLGHQFEEKLTVEPAIVDRLRDADEASLQVMHETRKNLRRRKLVSRAAQALVQSVIELDADEEDEDVQFVNATKQKKKKSKRRHSDRAVEDEDDVVEIEANSPKKSKKSKKGEVMDADVSQDLQWLQKL